MSSKLSIILLELFLLCYTADAATYFADGRDCKRNCEWPYEPAICRFNFTVELYYSMSKACYDCPFNMTDCDSQDCVPLNGVGRAILTVNRQFPGPKIEVCEGDSIEVAVTNHLSNAEGTSIHWHGVHVRNRQYMDGVSMLTQCPIPSYASFLYSLEVHPVGTHWWHGHSGMHRSDGIFGALIVRQAPSRDANYLLYDYDLSEHIMLVHDWLDQITVVKFSAHHHDDGSNKPESVLINGKGKRQEQTNDQGQTKFTPRETFRVKKGFRYRFRSISNAITNCPLKISIDNHTMLIISSDGAPTEPVKVDAFVIYGGERFDFVLNANQTIDNYWVRVKGLADCNSVQELAILQYEGAVYENPHLSETTDREGTILNPFNTPATDENIAIVELNAIEDIEEPEDQALLQQEPDHKFYIAMDFNKVNNYHFHHPEYYPIEEIDRSHHLYSKQRNLTRKLERAIKKDTVIVPDGGYTIIRFHATNPGWWLFHCHLEFHVEIGMALVIHVGNDSDLPKIPENFPRCGSWPQSTSPTTKPTDNTPSTSPIASEINMMFILFCVFFAVIHA
ncbi:laccase-1-like [Anneissia japonica]|uniref:laccase-1-like n=1 Tax=Anneissia japonica TaxID=1529436 RepID=UPI0014257707|nr:laccase-1-like [Anneissia japonica]